MDPRFDPRRPERSAQRHDWARAVLDRDHLEVREASVDASFRSYWRVRDHDRSLIVMDAPPEKEDCRPFLDVAARLHAAGLHAPSILAQDVGQGFLLLEDLGDVLFRDLIEEQNPYPWFDQAFDVLECFATRVDPAGLPVYGPTKLREELDLFTDWYLAGQLQAPLEAAERVLWNDLCERLIESAAEQPQVFVHRDFHSCNLMQADPSPGIIDFQDAVIGPVSYDLVSLLLDRYITWPRPRYLEWIEAFRQRLGSPADADTWRRWCDWMGLQRNLKVVGIFARLDQRDGKPRYLDLQPRFLGYVRDGMGRYPQFDAFRRCLEERL